MKNGHVLFITLILFFNTCFSQIGVLHPFSWPVGYNNAGSTISTLMMYDTSANVWFAACDTAYDSIYIINEAGTIEYGVPTFPAQTIYGANEIMIDSRNDIWVTPGGSTPVSRIHNSVRQNFYFPVPDTPTYNYGTVWMMADDHHGIDYFLYTTFNSSIDSLYLASFDGTTLTSTNIVSILPQINPNEDYIYLSSDHNGNIYVMDSSNVYKYNGQQWRTYPTFPRFF